MARRHAGPAEISASGMTMSKRREVPAASFVARRLAGAVALCAALTLPLVAFAQTPELPAATLTLPRDLSPWGMFMAADIVVKAVMVGLAFASVLTWTI